MRDETCALVHCLGVGAEEAVPAAALAAELNFAPSRTAERIRELARDANLAGIAVVAGPNGFYLAGSFEEIRAYEQSLISRAMAILERAKALATVEPELAGTFGG